MDKLQVISFIEAQLATGKISKDDLLNLTNGAVVTSQTPISVPIANNTYQEKRESSRNLIHVFYAIGAIIAIVGVGILVGQNWEEIGFIGRIFVTLGISFITYVTGLIMRGPEKRVISQIMFIISSVLAPLGVYILLNEANITIDLNINLIMAVSLSIIYGVAFFISKRNILLVITAGLLTWVYYVFILKVIGERYITADMLKWSCMILGFAYLFIGFGLKSFFKSIDSSEQEERERVQGLFYLLGTLAILGAGISIGGIFDLIFIAFIFTAFYGSVYLKNQGMLALGALFLMGHIIKLTSEYFVDSIGWPVALIAIGFLVIGVGYMTFYLNKKFISQE